jgi:hypothetical protein
MLGYLWSATRGYRLTPWRSPYILWRIETYWGLHAAEITFPVFWRFVWTRRWDLLRFMRWTGRMAHP